MKVICRTNLDLRNEEWPDELPEVPRVGDYITSATKRGTFQLELKVVRVTWKKVDSWSKPNGEWLPIVELHMTDWQRHLTSSTEGVGQGSITAFYEWYAPAVGTTVGAFI